MNAVITYCFIALLFIVNLEASSSSDFEKYGIAFFTSVTGDSVNFENSTVNRFIRLHDSMIIDSESLLSTGDSDYVFFKLSNNTTFGLLENTQFRIQSFKQNIFQEKNIRLDREPSISNFISTLNEGTIIVKSNDLSALSVFEIHLPIPNSKLELYSVKAVISYRYNILHIALYEGNISLKTNNTTKYINAPSYYVSDDYNLANSIKNHASNLSDTPDRWNAVKDYISVENDSVIFFPSTTASDCAAEAKLISTPDFYNQSFSRPRSFKNPQLQD